MRRPALCEILLVSAACLMYRVLADPLIVSEPEIIGVYPRQAAVLTCRIFSPEPMLASWSSVTYDYKISQGNQILINDVAKYSLINLLGGQIYNLQILNIDQSDEGFYKCAINGTNQQIITHLKVLDPPSHLLPGGSLLNLTDCCLVEGVTHPCLPACYPHQIDLREFNMTANCGTVGNLRGLSKCFTGSSNYDSCCLKLNVESLCLGICHSATPESLSTEYLDKCFSDDNLKGIFQCFGDGFELLPSEPTDVTAVMQCETLPESILIKWNEPIRNPQSVTGYKIMYRMNTEDTYRSVLVRNPKSHQHQINRTEGRIMSNADYKFHVSALALQGVSPKSLEVGLHVPECTVSPIKQNTSTAGTIPTAYFPTGTVLTTNTHKQADSDDDVSRKEVSIGIGAAFAAVVLIAVFFLVIFLNRTRAALSEMKDPVAFDNPGVSNLEPVKIKL